MDGRKGLTMFNSIVSFIISIILKFAAIIMSIITIPIFALVSLIFPSFGSYLSTFDLFISQYVVKGVAFAREVFLNITGFPRGLFTIIVTIYLAKITFHISSIPIKFLIHTINMIRGVPDSSISESLKGTPPN